MTAGPVVSAQPLQTAPVQSAALAASAQAAFGVPQRKLGSTGELVSMLGLGGAHIGDKSKLSDSESIQLMRDAIEGGITFFDNCWDYNDGLSQERMGQSAA